MKICGIMATKGRHQLAERALRFFLMQDHPDSHLLIYNNSKYPQLLEFVDRVTLVNNHIDLETGKPYDNMGAIYRDAMRYVPEDVEVVTMFDDDDIYHTSHFSQGAQGMRRAQPLGMIAYKPARSWFKYVHRISLEANTMEPSIFVRKDHVQRYGFGMETASQHLQWIRPLLANNQMLEAPDDPPTIVYNWGDNFPVFHVSGRTGDPGNFDDFAANSTDHGDGILTPITEQEARNYFRPFEKSL